MDTLFLQPGQDHLEKVARTNDPLRGINELVWNALDADALEVRVEFDKNPLGGLQAIRVVDDGTGIPNESLRAEFNQLGDSWKRTVTRTRKFGRAMHGKEGRGRLRFFSLAGAAQWVSIYRGGEGLRQATAEIEAAKLAQCVVDDAEITDQERQTGTSVELTSLKDTYDWLTGQAAFQDFGITFAPYVIQYPNVSIIYNGQKIDPARSVRREERIALPPLGGLRNRVDDLQLKVIEWNGAVQDRRIYLGSDEGIALASQPANVTAPGFEFSAYAYSVFFEQMHSLNMLELGDLTDPDLQLILEHIREGLTDYFRARQAETTAGLIEELTAEGAYPYEGDPKNDIEKKEREVFNIATYAISSYSRNFKRADTAMKRITLALLREALRHNPEAITKILKAVVDLPKNRQDEFSSLLERTALGNIISASSLVADRVLALQVIHDLVFNPTHRLTTRERGELDAIVQNNTWIFGEEFHISLPEVGLTRVMERVTDELGGKASKRKVTLADGQVGRADAFLGRRIPYPNHDHKEFLIIELKRPSVVVGRKEMDQLESYAVALTSQPDYRNNSTSWTFILMTNEVKQEQMNRITQSNRPPGLFLDNPGVKVWIKTWSEVLRQAEARIRFIQEKLQIEVTDGEIERRISDLRSSILKQRAA